MVSNVNPTDPKFIDGDDLDTEGHAFPRYADGVSPTEQDTAVLRNEPAEEDDTEGHLRSFATDSAEGLVRATDDGEDDTEGHLARV